MVSFHPKDEVEPESGDEPSAERAPGAAHPSMTDGVGFPCNHPADTPERPAAQGGGVRPASAARQRCQLMPPGVGPGGEPAAWRGRLTFSNENRSQDQWGPLNSLPGRPLWAMVAVAVRGEDGGCVQGRPPPGVPLPLRAQGFPRAWPAPGSGKWTGGSWRLSPRTLG